LHAIGFLSKSKGTLFLNLQYSPTKGMMNINKTIFCHYYFVWLVA